MDRFLWCIFVFSISGSRTDLRVSSRPQRHHLQSSATPSESDHAGELIQEFINMVNVCC